MRNQKNSLKICHVMFASLNVSIAVVLIVLAKPLAFVLFQKEFFRAWEATTVLLFAYLFNFLAGILGTVYTSAKKTSFIFTSTIVGAVVNIILNVILVRIWGIIGAAVATLLSYMCVWMLRVINVRKILRFQFAFRCKQLFVFTRCTRNSASS